MICSHYGCSGFSEEIPAVLYGNHWRFSVFCIAHVCAVYSNNVGRNLSGLLQPLRGWATRCQTEDTTTCTSYMVASELLHHLILHWELGTSIDLLDYVTGIGNGITWVHSNNTFPMIHMNTPCPKFRVIFCTRLTNKNVKTKYFSVTRKVLSLFTLPLHWNIIVLLITIATRASALLTCSKSRVILAA